MKTKRIKRPVCYLVGLLVFWSDAVFLLTGRNRSGLTETTGKIIKGKNREPEYRCSTELVRSSHQTPVVTTRSVATHFELMTACIGRRATKIEKESLK